MMAHLRVFHIDSGRKYFAPGDIRDLIDVLAENGFDAMEIAVGNEGWRLLLDDMSVETPSGNYADGDVREALKAGNRRYCDSGANEWTEEEMDGILSYASEKGVGIIPLLDVPGHMSSVVTAMTLLDIPSPSLKGSASAVDPDNEAAIGFAGALVRKYIDYFAARGCRFINFGADEYGIDLDGVTGFARLQDPANYAYGRFIDFANGIADHIIEKGAVPVMYNDGMYYACDLGGGMLRSGIICSYWTAGWKGYDLAPAPFIAGKGHPILTTHREWYYVLGREGMGQGTPSFTYEKALRGIETIPEGTVIGGGEAMGSMLCVWCNEPNVPYGDREKERVRTMIRLFAEKNGKG